MPDRSTSTPTESPVIERVRSLVEPIARDLDLDLYDLEQRGGTIRVTLDTPPGSEGGVDLDKLALATRLVSRELDHDDPVPGRYTLEVTSPGVERTLRLPSHFQREIGKTLNIRLADVGSEQRRVEGVLVAADDRAATLRIDDPDSVEPVERVVAYTDIDRARTVFVWGPQPKPGGPKAGRPKKGPGTPAGARPASENPASENQEKHSS